MYRTILVPVDGSMFAEHALPLALALARRCGAAIHLATVAPPAPSYAVEGVYLGPSDLVDATIASCQAYLENTTARLRERFAAPITGEVIFGDAAAILCDLASSGKYDLVVMATHGRNPLGRFFLGSVADKMIRRINLPLLLVRPETEEVDLAKEPDLSRVVVPLDGTPLAEQIIEPAVALAGLMPGAEIALVRAIPATGPDEEADVLDSLSYRDAGDYLASVARSLAARGLRVQTHVVFEDRPAEAILNEADDRRAGMIALETHGRSGLARLRYGSIADKVVHGAHIPVLVHRPVKV